MPYWTEVDGELVYVNEDGSITPFEQAAMLPEGGYQPDEIEMPAEDRPAPVATEEPADIEMPPEDVPGRSGQDYSYGVREMAENYNPQMLKEAKGGYTKRVAAAEKWGESGRKQAAGMLANASVARSTAIEGVSGIQQKIAAKEAEWRSNIARLQMDQAKKEQDAMIASQQVVSNARNRYLSQVQAFQSMQVDPNQVWGQMDGAGKFQTLAAVFVAGFLGARGIPTEVMSTINKAIDRNIAAQEANIQKQGQVAQMFGQLYDMARSESASDAEARLRLRGLYMAQMENAMLAELAQYDAPLAKAKAAEMQAMLQEQFVKDLQDLEQVWFDRVDSIRKTETQRYGIEVSAAQQKKDRELRERLATLDTVGKAREGDARAKEELKKRIILEAGTGRPVAFALPGTSESALNNLRGAGADLQAFVEKAAALRNKMAKAGPVLQTGIGWMDVALNDELKRDIIAMQTDLGYAKAKMNNPDGRISDPDFEYAKKQVPADTLLTQGDVDLILNNAISQAYREYELSVSAKAEMIDTPDEMEAAMGVQGYVDPSQGQAYATEAAGWGVPPVVTPTSDAIKHADSKKNKVVDQEQWLDMAYRSANKSGNPAEMADVTAATKKHDTLEKDYSGMRNKAEDAERRLAGMPTDDELDALLQVTPDMWSPEDADKMQRFVKANENDPRIVEYVRKLQNAE